MKRNKIAALAAFTIPPLTGLGWVINTEPYWIGFDVLVVSVSVMIGYLLYKS